MIRLCSKAFVRLATSRSGGPSERDRGDVPGWVLITVMTAGLVTALWVVAAPQLTGFFQSALNAVHGP